MRVLVLGIGNTLLQDEGVGVHVVQALRHRYQIPAEIELLDGGTAGMSLLEDLMDKDHVIIIDAIHTGEPPGTMVRLEDEAVPVFLQQRISPHQLGLSEVLAALVLVDKKPRHLVLIGIVPERMEL
ncbi:MAG TPA: HyaD/HybD family hydrogenase maturation endopeptidase, partial [Candidatus Competibacteraceae bacterium]|nr:HyaD/HybD family hydrogenase maturation endopeptidase [Candidatus Competibacteraceae bacterium]